jgi:hypothetical protein
MRWITVLAALLIAAPAVADPLEGEFSSLFVVPVAAINITDQTLEPHFEGGAGFGYNYRDDFTGFLTINFIFGGGETQNRLSIMAGSTIANVGMTGLALELTERPEQPFLTRLKIPIGLGRTVEFD